MREACIIKAWFQQSRREHWSQWLWVHFKAHGTKNISLEHYQGDHPPIDFIKFVFSHWNDSNSRGHPLNHVYPCLSESQSRNSPSETTYLPPSQPWEDHHCRWILCRHMRQNFPSFKQNHFGWIKAIRHMHEHPWIHWIFKLYVCCGVDWDLTFPFIWSQLMSKFC